MATSFSSRRAIAPMMWVLVALSGVELVVVHALIAFWWPAAAIGLSVVTLGGIVWLVAVIRSLAARPSVVEGGRLVLRCGRLREVVVPLEQVAAVETDGITDAAVKSRDVLNLALIAFPNVVVQLREPLRLNRREVRAIAHRFDDLPGFVAAVRPALSPAPSREGLETFPPSHLHATPSR